MENRGGADPERGVCLLKGRIQSPRHGDEEPRDARGRGWRDTISGHGCWRPLKPEAPGGPSAWTPCRRLDLRCPHSGDGMVGVGGADFGCSKGSLVTLCFSSWRKPGKATQRWPPPRLPPLGWTRLPARQTLGPLGQGQPRSAAPEGLGAKRLVSGVTPSFLFCLQ